MFGKERSTHHWRPYKAPLAKVKSTNVLKDRLIWTWCMGYWVELFNTWMNFAADQGSRENFEHVVLGFYRIRSNFWKFYLIRTDFTLADPVYSVKVFRLFRLEWIFFGVQSVWTQCIDVQHILSIRRVSLFVMPSLFLHPHPQIWKCGEGGLNGFFLNFFFGI